MEILIKASQLILSLSILVVLHELGHFIPARIFKTRVEKFYLFFNPWFSLFKYKKGDTEYGIGWLPLGGYVKISGMIDESMDKDQMSKPPEPYEFRSKPAWQRLIIMIGGVTVNLILAFLIYMMVLFVWGKEEMPMSNLPEGLAVDPLMEEYGFRDGDIITSIDGEAIDDFNGVNKQIAIYGAESVGVQRPDGTDTMINLPEDFEYTLHENGVRRPFFPRFPAVIGEIVEDAPAEEAGFESGDKILEVNGEPIVYWSDFTKFMRGKESEELSMIVLREGQEVEINVTSDDEGKVGIGPKDPEFETKHVSYSFFSAIPNGVSYGVNTLEDYVVSLKFLGTSSGIKEVGGFGTIGNLFPAIWSWQAFWTLTAFLSVILAFMNILPIPALDGGHVMFLLYEMIAGRPPGQKFMEYAQMVGMILLLGLILYANFNDVLRLF